jgi:hypothetical protein
MRRLIQSLEQKRVEYLLIGGQASILYGAATFSEDIDIWLRPGPRNVIRLLEALAACRARVHRLTPPLSPQHARAGHGFHFVLPAGSIPTYVDVMVFPPRVTSFAIAARRARRLRTSVGVIPVVSIEDLVALKRTRRLADYETISNLVWARLAEADPVTRRLTRWAAATTFRAEDRTRWLRSLGHKADAERCRRQIAREVAAHQTADVRYWRRRIDDLARLRRAGRLLEEGRPVAQVLESRRSGSGRPHRPDRRV